MDKHTPTLRISTSDDDIKEAENEQYKMEFKAEYDGFMKRKQSLETNTTNVYELLWKTMCQRNAK